MALYKTEPVVREMREMTDIDLFSTENL